MDGKHLSRFPSETSVFNFLRSSVYGVVHWHASWQYEAGMAHGSRDGEEGRALASHQFDPGLIPGPGVICGLSLLLVPHSAPSWFPPGTRVFHSPQ